MKRPYSFTDCNDPSKRRKHSHQLDPLIWSRLPLDIFRMIGQMASPEALRTLLCLSAGYRSYLLSVVNIEAYFDYTQKRGACNQVYTRFAKSEPVLRSVAAWHALKNHPMSLRNIPLLGEQLLKDGLSPSRLFLSLFVERGLTMISISIPYPRHPFYYLLRNVVPPDGKRIIDLGGEGPLHHIHLEANDIYLAFRGHSGLKVYHGGLLSDTALEEIEGHFI